MDVPTDPLEKLRTLSLIHISFLRKCMLRWPVLTPVAVGMIYVPLTLFYPFQMDIQFFFLLRVPEVLFGMYFIKYLYGTKQQREKYNWKWGLCSFAAVCTVMTIKTSIPVPFKILWTGIPIFLFLVWAGQLIRNAVVRKGISIFASYTFAIYLVHHILVDVYKRQPLLRNCFSTTAAQKHSATSYSK